MLRNRHNPNTMGYAGEPPQPAYPPISKLDPKDERLIEQSEDNGYLKGLNEMLNEDNRRLEQENAELRGQMQEVQERNTILESREAAASAGYKSGQQLVDEIEAALTSKKEKK